MILAKIAAITLLLGIAGYAAGQSGQHRRREQRARRLYLELVAFKPFSEPLPDAEKNAVRKEFIERLFVGDPGAEGEDPKDDVKLSDENLSVLLKFIDVVRSTGSSSRAAWPVVPYLKRRPGRGSNKKTRLRGSSCEVGNQPTNA